MFFKFILASYCFNMKLYNGFGSPQILEFMNEFINIVID